MEKSFLQVTKVGEVVQDKNGMNYKRLSARPLASSMVDPMTGEVHPIIDLTAREVSFNQYEENYLDGSKDPAYDAPIGTLIPGAVVSKSVEDYSFENSEGETIDASSYTTAVFGDTSDEKLFETAIFAAFRRAEHPLEGDPRSEDNIELEKEETAQPVED